MNNDFLAECESKATGAKFSPAAYYDPDGDCIELFLSPESFKAERLDKWVTVYRGRDSNEIVGSLIKNIRELFDRFPGLQIDLVGRRVRVSHILRAPAWATGDEVVRRVYKDILSKVDEADVVADLQCA